MPGIFLNADDTDVTGWGGSAVNVTKRSEVAQGAATDAQSITGVDAGEKRAILDANVTNAGRAAIASTLLDTILTDTRIDLSTPAKRKAFRLKAGLDELELILAQIAPDTAI